MASYVDNAVISICSGKNDHPNITDFDNFLPWACKQYSIGTKVFIGKTTQTKRRNAPVVEKKHSQNFKQSKVVKSVFNSEGGLGEDDNLSSASPIDYNKAIVIETIYDINEHLVQLKFLKNKSIPPNVMQVIALAVPYHPYLASITIDSGLPMETLHEISKFLPASNITEICLDNTFVSRANYHTLLSHNKLKHLSLARCSINDAALKTITDRLVPPHPAASVLSVLNLSSNRITDDGAKYIAEMLRTNGQLSYLNLAGNMITDEGGSWIFATMQKFIVKSQELFESRARYVAFLKKKKELVNKLIKEFQAAEEKMARKRTAKKILEYSKSTGEKIDIDTDSDVRKIPERAASLAERRMGTFKDNLSLNNTELRNGVVYCLGNNTLCCLNLAYNNLTYVSVKRLLDVLVAQKSLNRTPRGLVRVVIEGNLMPIDCKEYQEINSLLQSRIGLFKSQFEKKKAMSIDRAYNKILK